MCEPFFLKTTSRHSVIQLPDSHKLMKHAVLYQLLLCVCLFSCGLAGTQSQLNLERSKSRMGTFVEGGPMAETNPDEG